MKKTLVALMITVCAFAQKPEKPLKNGLYANFKTEFGDMKAILFEKDTPRAVGLFVNLAQGQQEFRDVDGKIAKRPYYNDTTFFRIVPGDAVQGGSLTGATTYQCGLKINDEFLPGIKFRFGSLAIANSGAPDSGGCQFFFALQQKASWDGKYTIFGQLVEGDDVLRQLGHVPVHGETPDNPPKLISVTFQRVGPPPGHKTKK
ncbi:MAG TPA: peptidylprolyl isomerase [Bryobacteraceae bacterium]|nr:peptidylprolyl isomerase [Bryobacteraceae bacterium]